MKLVESVEIEAPAETVWQAIVDLDRYGEWNPFVVAAESTLEVGTPIRMRVRLFERFTQPQTETVQAFEPLRRLCYGLAAQFLGAISSERCHELEPIGDRRCRYTSRFELSGWLSGLVKGLMGSRLQRGFASNTAALKRRGEELARAAEGQSPPAA